MKKKLLSLLLSFSLAATLSVFPSTQAVAVEDTSPEASLAEDGASLPMANTAAHTPADESLFIYRVSDGKATVTGTSADISGDIVIPATLGGYPVTEIGYRAFQARMKITSLVIPEGVTSIADYAIYNCTGLASITIPASVTSIGNNVFDACTRLASITVDAENIKYHSADNCLIETASKTLILGCKNSVIPADGSVTVIGSNAFNYCMSLASVEIPASVTSIGNKAFYNCIDLTAVSFAPGSQLTSIGANAFYRCAKLTSIEIPACVTDIGHNAFYGCCKLIEVCDASALSLQAGSADYGGVAKYAKNVYTPKNGESELFSQGDYLFYADDDAYDLVAYTGSGTDITLPESVSGNGYRIHPYAFADYRDLFSVTIPDSVTDIGENAFYSCTALASVKLSDGITSIADNLFGCCRSLERITIPSNVTSIGQGSFYACDRLSSVAIPNRVTSIGTAAFSACDSLSEIVIPASVTSISPSAFSACVNLVSLTVADGNTTYHAVGNCLIETASKTLVVGTNRSVIPYDGSVTRIGDSAFCAMSLTKIEIPASVSYIDSDAFLGCDDLVCVTVLNPTVARWITSSYSEGNLCSYAKTVLIPENVTDIGSYITDNFTNVHSMVVGGRLFTLYSKHSHAADSALWVKDICTECGMEKSKVADESLFTYTVSDDKATIIDVDTSILGDIIIPDTLGGYPVVSIESQAFKDCERLTSVTIPGGVVCIGSSVFEGCIGLASVEIPAGVTSIGAGCFWNCRSLVSVTIPEGVTSIDVYTFFGCSNLSSIEIPASVTSIDDRAFERCTGLLSVTILSPTVAASITRNTSQGYLCYYAKTVTVPETAGTVGAYITKNFTFVDEINVNGAPCRAYSKHSHADDSALWVGRVCTECGLVRGLAQGDINGDFVVDIVDIVAVIDEASGDELDPTAYPGETDLEQDGMVDIADIVAVIDLAAGQ